MSNELVVVEEKKSLLEGLASKLGVDRAKMQQVLEDTVFKKMSPAQMYTFCLTANMYNLNPFTKEIYGINFAGTITTYVSIDGWLKIINDNPMLNQITAEVSEDGKSATATIRRKDREYPTVITEYLDECMPKQLPNNSPWLKCPRRMLRHKAIIQCARVAFGLSGLQDKDDAYAEAISQKSVVPETRKVSFYKALQKQNADAEATVEPQADEFLEALEEQN